MGSNSAGNVYIRLFSLLCYVGSGLCDELSTCSEDSYSVRACARACVRVCVCVRERERDLETSITRQPRPVLGCNATETTDGTNASIWVCEQLVPHKGTKEKN